MNGLRVAIPAGIALTLVAANRLGHTYGATAAERATPLPGDELVAPVQCVCTHATTIAAPPNAVWPWLVQMGWHRGGWYTARWVDRLLFPANRPSADKIVPELQSLRVGDFVPDGPPQTRCGFTVVEMIADTAIVLRSDSHLPSSWRTKGLARLDWTWAFALFAVDGGAHTRFVFRWRARMHPWWLRVLCAVAVVPADLLMSRDMLRGVKRRGEHAVPM
ncbi:MAG TPA: SRPBCC family protein [Aldersonia sp.]